MRIAVSSPNVETTDIIEDDSRVSGLALGFWAASFTGGFWEEDEGNNEDGDEVASLRSARAAAEGLADGNGMLPSLQPWYVELLLLSG